MKYFLLLSLFSFTAFGAERLDSDKAKSASPTSKSCGSETVNWPKSGVCGAQLYANGGVPVGFQQVAFDPSHPGSDALFRCTADKGWVFVSGVCPVEPAEEVPPKKTPVSKETAPPAR